MTARSVQERAGVTNRSQSEEERQFATNAQVIRHWALNLYEAQSRFTKGEGDIYAILGPLGVLERHGCPVSTCNTIIRMANRGQPFQFHLVESAA